MKRTTRTAAGAVALAVALGAASPVAATAAGHDKRGHVKVDKADKAGKAAGKAADERSTRKGAQELRQLLRDIATTDSRLVMVTSGSRLAALGDHAPAVQANVEADRAALVELVTAVQAADSALDLRQLRKELREVREQNYAEVANDLRHADELLAAIAAARVALAADPAAPLADLDAASAAVEAAVAKALQITASSDRAALRSVKADLQAAHQAFDAVTAYLEGLVEEPVVEEPVV